MSNANSALSLDAVFHCRQFHRDRVGGLHGGSEITGTQIQSQELNGRNPLYMAQTLPGVRGGEPFRSTERAHDTIVTFDGAPSLRTRASGAVIGVAEVAAVQEVQAMPADYSAEYGRAAGGQIRIISKSGTRDFTEACTNTSATPI